MTLTLFPDRVTLTLTPDELRELRASQSPVTGNIAWACTVALGEADPGPDAGYTRADAMKACVEAWNRRHESQWMRPP